MSFRGPQEAENGPLEVPGNAKGPFGEFPRIDFGDPPPPRNGTKLFTDLLQPTFEEGTGSFVSGGPYGPKGEPPPPPSK